MSKDAAVNVDEVLTNLVKEQNEVNSQILQLQQKDRDLSSKITELRALKFANEPQVLKDGRDWSDAHTQALLQKLRASMGTMFQVSFGSVHFTTNLQADMWHIQIELKQKKRIQLSVRGKALMEVVHGQQILSYNYDFRVTCDFVLEKKCEDVLGCILQKIQDNIFYAFTWLDSDGMYGHSNGKKVSTSDLLREMLNQNDDFDSVLAYLSFYKLWFQSLSEANRSSGSGSLNIMRECFMNQTIGLSQRITSSTIEMLKKAIDTTGNDFYQYQFHDDIFYVISGHFNLPEYIKHLAFEKQGADYIVVDGSQHINRLILAEKLMQ